jgi:hypothetical protein
MDEVLNVQGEPTRSGTDTLFYGSSTIHFGTSFSWGGFEERKVDSWHQDPGSPLKVKWLPSNPVKSRGYFVVGSYIDEVLALHGTPTGLSPATNYNTRNHQILTYGSSSVTFEDGRVQSWSETSANPLKAK